MLAKRRRILQLLLVPKTFRCGCEDDQECRLFEYPKVLSQAHATIPVSGGLLALHQPRAAVRSAGSTFIADPHNLLRRRRRP
jgi:hypothetical protein